MFLDSNAHVPMNNETLDYFVKLNNSLESHGHPLSPSKPGRKAAKLIEQSREKIAELIGAKDSNQIIFTKGCTQACEWGMQMFANISNIIVNISQLEHPSVQQAAEKYFSFINDFKIKNNKIEIKNPNLGGVICIHMQNETGTLQPLHLLKEAFIFSDMSQSLGKIYLNVTDLNVDIAAFSAQKFGGQAGIGFLYIKDTKIWNDCNTGSRYELDIPGTPDVTGIATTAFALEKALDTIEERAYNQVQFRNILEPRLKELNIKIIGKDSIRCPNTSFIQLPKDKNSHELLFKLEENDIYCGLGSACGSLHAGTSTLMEKLGEDSDASRYMRISQWGNYKAKDAEHFLTILKEVL